MILATLAGNRRALAQGLPPAPPETTIGGSGQCPSVWLCFVGGKNESNATEYIDTGRGVLGQFRVDSEGRQIVENDEIQVLWRQVPPLWITLRPKGKAA